MDNVTLKAPDDGQSFNYLHTRGINIIFFNIPFIMKAKIQCQ